MKYVVITGASSGIGFSAAKAFAKLNKNLILIARRNVPLQQLKSDILAQNPALDIVIKCVDLSVPEKALQLYQDLAMYSLETWINNAGFGHYGSVSEQDIMKTLSMIRLNIEALTILSTQFVHDYQHVEDTQLINVSSAGGYQIVPNAVTYCATKFFVSAFSEGLARELKSAGAKMRVKILAPAATETEFASVANSSSTYHYADMFTQFNTPDEIADLLITLYQHDHVVAQVSRDTFNFSFSDPQFPYANSPIKNA